ncbi:MAG: hypothetical protein JSW28_01405, partial [Thermoplasmata archaeon]
YYGGISGTPNVWVDGTLNKPGATGQGVEAMYEVYADHIEQRAPVTAPFTITLSGEISGSKAHLTAEIDGSEGADTSGVYVRFALMEDGLEYNGKTFDWVLRNLAEGPLPVTAYPIVIRESFDLGDGWSEDNLRAVVWVQDDTSLEVGQAAFYDFGA